MIIADEAVRTCVANFGGRPLEKHRLEVYLASRLSNTNLPLTDERIECYYPMGVPYVLSLSRPRSMPPTS
ncbi:MAG: hypothetical protein WDO69_33635 [Pseudomonadota bacterium]